MRAAEYDSAENKKFNLVHKTQHENTQPKKENKGRGNSPLAVPVGNPAEKYPDGEHREGVGKKINVEILYVYGKRKNGDEVKCRYKRCPAYKQRRGGHKCGFVPKTVSITSSPVSWDRRFLFLLDHKGDGKTQKCRNSEEENKEIKTEIPHQNGADVRGNGIVYYRKDTVYAECLSPSLLA